MLSVVILVVVMLSVVMLSVIMLSVILLMVMAPCLCIQFFQIRQWLNDILWFTWVGQFYKPFLSVIYKFL